jgi:SpoIID/LytB domain protein
MKKKSKQLLSFITAFMLLFSFTSAVYPNNVQAYSNSKMFNEVKVGLVSMSSTLLTAVLTGGYTLNGMQQPSGTVLTIKANNNMLKVNGVDYSEVQLLPLSSSSLVTLTSGTATYKYQGSFLFRVSSDKVLPVNFLDIETYLKGVVGYEMSDYFPLEALKAQAVAARNYAMVSLGSEAAKGYDFDDTTLYQVYKGYDYRLKNVIRAVEETRFVILLYNDKLAETLYSAWHGGYSEDAVNVWGNSVIYLKSKADSFENEPWPNGNISFTNAQIDSTLKAGNWLLPSETFLKLNLESITRFTSGRVSNIDITYVDSLGLVKTKSVTKDKTRTFLGFPSNMFTASYDSVTGVYTFSGKGNGHGLGMSQIGAKNRAASGETYEQILKFYYDGSYLQNLTPKASMLSFNASSSEIFTNASVALNALGTGGSGQYLYRYQILRNGVEVFNTQFNDISSLNYKPLQPGSYEIIAYVKDKHSSLSFDEKQSKLVNVTEVYKAPQIASARSTGKMFINTPVDISADIRFGSPSGYTIKYIIQSNGRTIAERSLNSSSSFSFTPTAAGKYTVSIQVKDNISANIFDSAKTFDLYIDVAPMKASKLSIKSRMKGTDVRTIQTGLSQLGYKVGTLDGIFGSKTLASVRSFQKSVRLKATGIVDAATFNSINNELLRNATVKIVSY